MMAPVGLQFVHDIAQHIVLAAREPVHTRPQVAGQIFLVSRSSQSILEIDEAMFMVSERIVL